MKPDLNSGSQAMRLCGCCPVKITTNSPARPGPWILGCVLWALWETDISHVSLPNGTDCRPDIFAKPHMVVCYEGTPVCGVERKTSHPCQAGQNDLFPLSGMKQLGAGPDWGLKSQ